MNYSIRIVAFVLFFAIVSESRSQTAFGLKGGINFTNFNVADAQGTYDSRTGYHAGFFLREKFNKVAFQPELLLFTQNNVIENYQGYYKVTQRFTYVSVPLMFKFYPIWGLNMQVGPQFGFLVDGQRKTDTPLGTSTEDIKDYYKQSDVSISSGIGYDFKFGLGVDVRYNIGLRDVNNASNGETAKSQVFLFRVNHNYLSSKH